MRIVTPASCLLPFIKAFIIVDGGEGMVSRLLPDTAIVLAFRYRGTVSYLNDGDDLILPAFSISGLRNSSKSVKYSPGSGNILVQFREGCAGAFLPLPAHELFDSSIPLDNLFGDSAIQQLEEQVYIADTIEAKIKIIEQFLMARLRVQHPDLLIGNSINRIQLANGILKIKHLAQSLNISHDAFEKRFRKTVGTTPKQFAAIVRMKSLVSQGNLNKPLTESALNAGFFDQSHFIREFKKFAGQTPREFFRL